MELEKGNNKIDERNRPVSLLECSTEPLRNEGRAIHNMNTAVHVTTGLSELKDLVEEDLPLIGAFNFCKTHEMCVLKRADRHSHHNLLPPSFNPEK